MYSSVISLWELYLAPNGYMYMVRGQRIVATRYTVISYMFALHKKNLFFNVCVKEFNMRGLENKLITYGSSFPVFLLQLLFLILFFFSFC